MLKIYRQLNAAIPSEARDRDTATAPSSTFRFNNEGTRSPPC